MKLTHTALAAALLIGTSGLAVADPNSSGPAAINGNGSVNTRTAGETPQAGHNSFTQAQAQHRIAKAGYTQVSGLAKDSNGIWRGTAKKNGQTVDVALDYKGHVTTGSGNTADVNGTGTRTGSVANQPADQTNGTSGATGAPGTSSMGSQGSAAANTGGSMQTQQPANATSATSMGLNNGAASNQGTFNSSMGMGQTSNPTTH